MLLNKKIPTKAEIFSREKRQNSHKLLKKPRFTRKTTGLLSMVGVFIVGVGMLLMPAGTTIHQLQASPIPTQSVEDEKTEVQHDDNPDRHTDDRFRLPDFRFIEQEPQLPPNFNPAPNGSNISGISQEIIVLQQEIANQMQSCSQSAAQLAADIAMLKAQREEVRNERRALNDFVNDIDTRTPEGEAERDALRAEREQLEVIEDQLRDTIREAQKDFRNGNSSCKKSIRELKRQQDRLQNGLGKQFRNSLDFRIH